ncbi:MAG: nucleotide exchange factor GrpE [Beijerinckiaceae bacterium]
MTAFKNGAPPEEGNPAAETGSPEAAANFAAPPVETPDPIAVLEAEKAEMKDRLLRTLAEMENLRRRTEKDMADARAYGVTRFARDMLDVADNLRRALDALPAESREAADGPVKALLDGIDLTERDLLKKLETHGVRKLEPVGQKFDPNFHQAMFEVPDETKPNGTVMQVIQSGYSIGDRVLRPAMVGVAKGGPREAPGKAG